MSKNKKSKSGESKTNKLERYERRVNQLETRREYFDAKIKFIENNFDKLVAEGVASLTTQEKARGYSIENRLKNDLDSFKKSRAKLDFLLLRNKGGVITQDMIDYNWPKKFQYTNEAENRDYVAGDVFVPKDGDRVNLIKNVKTDLGLIEPEPVEEEPVVEVQSVPTVDDLLEKLRIQETQLQRSDSKIDLTRTLQIEPRLELSTQNGK
tara:strand:- start:181 stop:807 length:627 start_codon:yes stop_codon:yes gene_type:complete